MSDRHEYAELVAKWRRCEPGSIGRRSLAERIEELERRLFGDRPHALGKPLEGNGNA